MKEKFKNSKIQKHTVNCNKMLYLWDSLRKRETQLFVVNQIPVSFLSPPVAKWHFSAPLRSVKIFSQGEFHTELAGCISWPGALDEHLTQPHRLWITCSFTKPTIDFYHQSLRASNIKVLDNKSHLFGVCYFSFVMEYSLSMCI